MKMGEVWPYLGCFLAIRNKNSIYRMNKIYNILDEKYKRWYGDQIAKIFASNFKKITLLEKINMLVFLERYLLTKINL